MKKESFKNKKGVTLTEVVVAMAIIAVISTIAIGMVSAFSAKVTKAVGIKEAASIANGTRQLFLFSDSEEEFIDLLPVVCDIELERTDGSDVYVITQPNYNGYFIASFPKTKEVTELPSETEYEEAVYSIVIKDLNNKVVIQVEGITKLVEVPLELVPAEETQK